MRSAQVKAERFELRSKDSRGGYPHINLSALRPSLRFRLLGCGDGITLESRGNL